MVADARHYSQQMEPGSHLRLHDVVGKSLHSAMISAYER